MEIAANNQLQKAQAFKALHERPGIFVIPNPWDAGSAKILTSLGFEALTTTSAGLAFSLSKPDGLAAVTRDETLKNANDIVAATHLPVAADLENGFGDDPETCAATILLAAKAGLVGGSIEDNSGKPDDPIYPFEYAVERVKAAVEAAKRLPFPFMLCARAENMIYGRIDLKDTIRRLVAFADAGADVLFAPGLRTKEEIEAVVKAVAPKPVNIVLGLGQANLSLSEIGDMGVKRISMGSALARVAYGAFLNAAEEVSKKGTFTFANSIVPYSVFNVLFEKK